MINIQGISKTYSSGVKALDNISLLIEKASFVSIIGPSGAGKSSLLKVINGSEIPDQGTVLINGSSKRIKKQLATIYQDFCLVEETTAIQNVLNAELADMNFIKVLLGLFTKEQKNRAKEELKKVGLQLQENTPVKELSGGQKQRVAVAKALMQKALVILADEPVSSLDPASSENVLSLLKALALQEGITVVMNIHNVELAVKYSDKIAGIKNGHLEFFTEPGNITPQMKKNLFEESCNANLLSGGIKKK